MQMTQLVAVAAALLYVGLGLHALRTVLLHRTAYWRHPMAIHGPLCMLCVAITVIRITWLVCYDHDATRYPISFIEMLCVQLPSVGIAAVDGYVIVCYAQFLHSPSAFVWKCQWNALTIVYLVVCAFLSISIGLYAWLYTSAIAQRVIIHQISIALVAYSTVLWSLVGFLLLKYHSQVMRILRHSQISKTRLHQWNICGVLLAILPLIRSVYCIVWFNISVYERPSLSFLLHHDVLWEVLTIGTILHLIHIIPSEKFGPLEVMMAFRIPTVSDIVDEYIMTTSQSFHESIVAVQKSVAQDLEAATVPLLRADD